MDWQKRVAVATLMIPLIVILVAGLAASNGKNDRKHHSSEKGDQNKAHDMDHGMKKKMHMKESGHAAEGGDKPIIITMEELHESGGTPPGWRFRIPKGDAADGREAFI